MFYKNLVFFTLCFSFLLNQIFGEPPRQIPKELYAKFTLNGRIPVGDYYLNDGYSSDNPIVYTTETINENICKATIKQPFYYGATDSYLFCALDKYENEIKDKNVAILGSVTPWYESILLAYQAYPTTIDYNKIVSNDQRLELLTVAEFEQNPKLFDALLSISSFEHDGLGRYGDPINPNGDFEAMKKAKKMLKKNGLLFLAVPVGKDVLMWNAHRVYGKIRLPLLLAGWEVVDSFGFSSKDYDIDNSAGTTHQPIFVLKKID